MKAHDKKWLKIKVGEMVDLFYLNGWEVETECFKEPKSDSPGAAAEMTTVWKYRQAILKIYPCFWQLEENERKETLIHEFCHVIVARPFLLIDNTKNGHLISGNEIDDIHEHTTSWIAQIISTQLKTL
mgnify:FL=1